ncbi:unnamed protein product [Parnassius apollo]|uniref:(apollo) hypothetical protein n=1 Tax=Parnassius apollo TaxID=110799 RepID=A0A8S3WFS3_PARAO|nr:unnamed protein product [Parnassius apollo]
MEATVLKKKKTTISKGKIKKTIKNVISRPDPVYWPVTSEAESKQIESILNKYHISIPEFKKPTWDVLKNMPKNARPKPPPLKKVDGLIFGLSECRLFSQIKQLSALILEAEINPRAIVQPLIEVCINTQVPVICLPGLKKSSASNFGISTSCLGVKSNFLPDLTETVIHISKNHNLPETNNVKVNNNELANFEMINSADNEKEPEIPNNVPRFSYLYRSDKKRVFVPTNDERATKIKKQFIGQDFIEFSKKLEKENKSYKKMVVKRISNNPNRQKDYNNTK